MHRIFIGLFLLSSFILKGQNGQEVYEDDIYTDNIKSVKLHLAGMPFSYPIIPLGSSNYLEFYFDDLDQENDSKNYTYKIIHCNADWTPSNLSELEYIDGFTEDIIRDFDFSFNTRTLYTNYHLQLPNPNMRWTKSGNYLLMVYEDESEKRLVITRRFMVVERLFKIASRFSPAIGSKSRTHHEIDFTLNHKGFDIRNPMLEIKATVLQNGRWDNALTDLQPLFIRNESLIFDYQNKINFPAGKEFRFVDCRTFRFKPVRVSSIRTFKDRIEFYLMKDIPRASATYLFNFDVNGNFIILSDDNFTSITSQNSSDSIPNLSSLSAREYNLDNLLESEYPYVNFTLDVNEPYYDQDIYLFGAFTDWKIKPEFQMQYNSETMEYVANIQLKQGYYNYYYAAVHVDKPNKIDMDLIEGNWFQTENDYCILVYYRPFGARYDRLVASKVINSNR